MLVVCLFWDLTKCLKPGVCVRLEQDQPKGRTGKKKRRRLHTCPYYYVGIAVSLAGKTKNERIRELAMKGVEYIYIGNHVTWPLSNT